jgi:UDP-N-acetyl-D-glucosamine dehydrogenase
MPTQLICRTAEPGGPARAAETAAADALLRRIESGAATVAVIGLGYVGLPLAHALHAGGLRVLGLDSDHAKVEALRAGEAYIKHFGPGLVKALALSARFDADTDMSRISEADAVVVCVPTPIGPHNEPDLSFILNAATAIGRAARRPQLVVLESTTYPGTTRTDFLPAIVRAGEGSGVRLAPGDDFFVAFSPEREDPGRQSHTIRTTPKLVGGLDPTSTRLAAALYRKGLERVVEVSSAEVAESAKLLENIFRCVNIAMVNELKTVLSAMEIDIWEVIEAASTKPFGFMPFHPGPGLGGHCIPIDPFYLTWKAREFGRSTRFIELAGEINTAMPRYVVERLTGALNRAGKPVQGSRVLVLGLAYKPNIDDTRESPSFELIRLLRELGADVDYSDPHVPRTHRARKHDLGMASVPLTPESIASYDAVLVATAHAAFDFAMIAEHARLIVDSRNALAPWAAALGQRLVKA